MESATQKLVKDGGKVSAEVGEGKVVHQEYCAYHRFAVVHRSSMLTDEQVREHLLKAVPRFQVNRGVPLDQIHNQIEVAMTTGAVRQYLDTGRRQYDSNARLDVFQCNCTPTLVTPEVEVGETKKRKKKSKKSKKTKREKVKLGQMGDLQLSEDSDKEESSIDLVLASKVGVLEVEGAGSKNPEDAEESTKIQDDNLILSDDSDTEDKQQQMESQAIEAVSELSSPARQELEAGGGVDAIEDRMDVDEGGTNLEGKGAESTMAETESEEAPSSPALSVSSAETIVESQSVLEELMGSGSEPVGEEDLEDLLEMLTDGSGPKGGVNVAEEGRSESSEEKAAGESGGEAGNSQGVERAPVASTVNPEEEELDYEEEEDDDDYVLSF